MRAMRVQLFQLPGWWRAATAPLQPLPLGTNDPHLGCRVSMGDLYHLPLLHVGSKLQNANGNVLKT